MKILHLARQDKGGGGGGFDAAYRLHCSMRTCGIESRMMVLQKESDDPDVIDVASHLKVSDRLRRFWYETLRRLARRRYRFSPYFHFNCQDVIPASRLGDMLPFRPDVIIVHWVSTFVTDAALRDLSRMTHAPILWYFMDMAPLTGGCHYTLGCNGFSMKCGNCPQLGAGKGPHDVSHRQWQNKCACLQETNITAVAASSWLKNQMESSSIFRDKRHETILLGVNVDVFCQLPQAKAREQLDLPNDRKIIFFGAQSLFEERKGIRHLVGALRLLYAMLHDNVTLRDQILVVTAGRSKNAADIDIAFEHRHIGFLAGDVMLAAGYQAADVFVNASIEDAGPMMINEALLCGTPVVAFEMGVAADIVHTDKTGYRAKLRDEQDMAAGMRRVLELHDEATRAMRERCRNYGLQKCHPNVQVQAFERLCSELIECGNYGSAGSTNREI